jgi:NADPH:quinone reductase-like Zn-dependent oxidoreductase
VRAAVLTEYGQSPRVGDFEEPRPGEDRLVLEVLAAGLNPVDRSVASGNFYGGSPPLPYVVGREGVGRTPDGERVYFDGPLAPFGSLAQRTAIDPESAIALPAELDSGLAVGLGIAGLAAWLALQWRGELRPGETVLVLGASGVVGQIGIQAAKLLGAGFVVAAARSADGLQRARELGADATVQIDAVDDLAEALRRASDGGVDLVLDPLWGEPAAAAIEAARPGARLVQLGQSAGAQSTIASAAVRGRMISILGHSNFRVAPEVKRRAYLSMVDHALAGDLAVPVERIGLEQSAQAWDRLASSPHQKLVIVP